MQSYVNTGILPDLFVAVSLNTANTLKFVVLPTTLLKQRLWLWHSFRPFKTLHSWKHIFSNELHSWLVKAWNLASMKTLMQKRVKHWQNRAGRVLSFFSIRRNWDSLNPSPAGECAPLPLVPGGGAQLACERGGGRVPIPTMGYTLWYSVCLFTLWLVFFQTLLETKTALDMEIAVYRKLVESEEDRLGIDNTDNSESQGVTNRCRRLSWLTNSALLYEPKCGGGGEYGVLANGFSWARIFKPFKAPRNQFRAWRNRFLRIDFCDP
jgi:hypothetical protein